jgi:hypothetical protein
MASFLMAIFAWIVSLFAAAEQPRPAASAARPVAVVATAQAKAAGVARAPHNPPIAYFASETGPAVAVPPDLCDAVVRLGDGRATMEGAFCEMRTLRITSAAGRCDRAITIRNVKLRNPSTPSLPQPLSALSRNS